MINEVGTLYKRGRNTILEWVIKIESINRQVNIFMSYGEINGAKVIRYQNNIKGKNIGKANETNPYEQALSIAESKINNKQREGYKLYKELFETNPDYFITFPLLKQLDGSYKELVLVSKFRMSDAATAGLLDGKDNWSNFPARMCDARAFATGSRECASDILFGMMSINELADANGVAYTITD